MHQIKLLISAVSIFLLLSSCQKEYSYENGESTPINSLATFSLAGTSGNCIDALVSGDYKVGNALTNENTIKIKVLVDSIGSYSITSNIINGISFSATGNFTSTGDQTVSLAGGGTPINAGDFNFNAGANGCKFSVSVADKDPGSSVFTYDGAPGHCTNISQTGRCVTGMPLTSLDIIKIDVNVTVTGSYSIKTSQINGFSFSGSGIFETAGYNVVFLTGNGTPILDGIFEFSPGNNGCLFPITVSQ